MIIRNRILLFLFFNLIFYYSGFSQKAEFNPYLEKLSGADDLIFDDITDVKIDSKGYLWILSFSELVYTNGTDYRTIDSDGIQHNSFLKFYESPFVGKFITDLNGSIFFIKNDSLIPYQWNSIIESFNIGYKILSLQFQKDSSLIFSSSSFSGIIQIKDGVTRKLVQFYDVTDMSVWINKQSPYFSYGLPISSYEDTLLKSKIYVNVYDSKENISDSILSFSNKYYSSAFERRLKNGVTLLWNSKATIVLIDSNLNIKSHPFPYQLLNAFIDGESNLWLSTRKNGLFKVPFCNFQSNEIKNYKLLNNFIVSDEDRDGRLWVYKESEGVFKIDPLLLENLGTTDLEKSNTQVFDIALTDSIIYYSTRSNFLSYYLKTDSLVRNKYPEDKHAGRAIPDNIFYSIHVKNNKSFGGQRSSLWILENNSWNDLQIDSIRGGGERLTMFGDNKHDKLFLTKWNRLYSYNFKSNEIVLEKLLEKKIKNFLFLNNRFLIHIEGSIMLLDRKLDIISSMPFDEKIIDWLFFKDSIWISTQTSVQILQVDSNLLSLNSKKSITEGRFAVENDSTLWIICSQGNTEVSLRNNASYIFKTYSPFPKIKVNKLDYNSNFLYIGTISKGLFRVSWNGLRKPYNQAAEIRIKSIKIKGLPAAIDQSVYSISESNNSIEINFEDVNYSDWKTSFRYRLSKSDDWIYVKESKIYLENLQADFYSFELQAQRGNQLWSDSLLILFDIIPPFWKRADLIILLSLFIALSIFIIIRTRFQSLERKNKLILDKLKAEQKFLRAQMNPHFIFNSLSSLKFLVIQNENDKATKFLDKLSVIIRGMLNQGRVIEVSLEEEIKFNQEYLKLEQIRLENKFSFQFEIGSDVDKDTKVPNLLIQPILENAIQHGIKNKVGKACICLKIHKEDNFLKVIITDDGVGLNRTLEQKAAKNKRYSSEGLKIIKDRISIHNKSKNGDEYMIIKDRCEYDNLKGTVVEMKIRII